VRRYRLWHLENPLRRKYGCKRRDDLHQSISLCTRLQIVCREHLICQDTGPTAIEVGQTSAVPIWALLNSLKNQYPNDPEVAALNYEQVHQAVRDAEAQICKKNDPLDTRAIWPHRYSDIVLAQGLQTLGLYRLVRCHEEDGQSVAVKIARSRNWFTTGKMFICISDLPQVTPNSLTSLP
jgi:hypothetical protein